MKKGYREENIESLTIELTQDCNNNCSFCYQKRRRKSKIDADQLKRKIVEFKKMGGKYIEFSGGEPTLSPHLPKLAELAKNVGYENISLLTNGRRLAYKNYFSCLIKAGLKTVIFSIPGHTPGLYKKITRTDKQSFRQLVGALETAEKEKNKIDIGTVTVINKHNYRHLPKIVKWLSRKKIGFITLSYPISLGEEVDKKIFPTCTEIYPYIKKALDKYRGTAKICIDGVPYCQLPGCERFILNEIFRKDCLIVGSQGKISNRLETIKMLNAKTAECNNCAYEGRCAGFFIDYKDKYDIAGKKKTHAEQKVALDIQSGSCDYDYVFCTRQIGGKRYNELHGDKAAVDYEKLEMFFKNSSKVSNHLDIWGRERPDEFPEIFKNGGEG